MTGTIVKVSAGSRVDPLTQYPGEGSLYRKVVMLGLFPEGEQGIDQREDQRSFPGTGTKAERYKSSWNAEGPPGLETLQRGRMLPHGEC